MDPQHQQVGEQLRHQREVVTSSSGDFVGSGALGIYVPLAGRDT